MHPVFNLEKATLLLEVPAFQIPEKIATYATERGMARKKELHCTVLGFGMGKKIIETMQQQGLSAEQQVFVLNHLSDSAKKISWSYQSTSEYFALSKKYSSDMERESIVCLITLAGEAAFVKKIKKLFGISVSLFPHVTLFAKSSDPEEIPVMGIGIQDIGEFLTTKKTRISA